MTLKMECASRLNLLFDVQVKKITNFISGLQGKLALVTGTKHLDLRSQITQAEFELFKLNMARDEGRP
jgi:hypothetical protein